MKFSYRDKIICVFNSIEAFCVDLKQQYIDVQIDTQKGTQQIIDPRQNLVIEIKVGELDEQLYRPRNRRKCNNNDVVFFEFRPQSSRYYDEENVDFKQDSFVPFNDNSLMSQYFE